jgi:hypothetical protein
VPRTTESKFVGVTKASSYLVYRSDLTDLFFRWNFEGALRGPGGKCVEVNTTTTSVPDSTLTQLKTCVPGSLKQRWNWYWFQ